MRLLTVDGHWRVRRDMPRHNPDIEAGLIFEWPGRWLRLFAVWGEAPGSMMAGKHWAAWRTRLAPDHTAWTVRAGWWPGPCLTALAQTRPNRPARPPLPWDDPERMAADLRQAVHDIEAQGALGRAISADDAADQARRMATWGPCLMCGAARDVRAIGSEGIPGRLSSGGVLDELWCPACGWTDPP
jgi:hypothetical protein